VLFPIAPPTHFSGKVKEKKIKVKEKEIPDALSDKQNFTF
jgi:hypothetical protein